MNSCRKWQLRMSEALYGELSEDARLSFEAHTASCPDCAAELAVLKETLGLIKGSGHPQPQEVFWERVWPEFLRRLDETGGLRPREPARFFRRRWVVQLAAAAALVVIGIFIGQRLRFAPQAEDAKSRAPVPLAAPGAIIDDRVDRYLERAKLVLWSVNNLELRDVEPGGLDLTPERKASKELLRETRALKADLRESRDEQLLDLVSELEIILLHIGNLRETQSLLGVELAKTGIQDRALLFKINLEEMRRVSERVSKSKHEKIEKGRRAARVG